MRLLAIGEILWDVFSDGARLGGAPFNFSAHATRLGHDVTFVSAVGDDDRGRRALEQVRELGLRTDYIGVVESPPTGHVTVRISAGGQPAYVIHRPAAYDRAELDDTALGDIVAWDPDWLCFGTLHQIDSRARALTRRLADKCPGARRFYDVNLRKDSYTPELVAELLGEANVLKLNDEEVAELGRMLEMPSSSPVEFCRRGAAAHGWQAVCVTRGAAGCSLWIDGEEAEVAARPVDVADTVGAGDAFAAAFLHGLGQGWDPQRIGDFANRVGGLVARRPGAIPRWSPSEID